MSDIEKIIDLAKEHYRQKEYEKAFKLYKQAAEQCNAEAQWLLGLCYKNGEGVEPDEEQAAYWHRRAMKQGYMDEKGSFGDMI